MVNILILNCSDAEGGADRSVYRLHKTLLALGVNSRILVQEKGRLNDDPSVIGPEGKIAKGFSQLRPPLDNLPLSLYPKKLKTTFSVGWLPGRVHTRADALTPDLIHLNWICNGFVTVKAMAKFAKPLVWTMHDFWPFTGGCHYPRECTRYQQQCGRCPHLNSSCEKDLSRWVWKKKAEGWKALNLTLIAPSRWLADCAQSSSLFKDVRIEVIPNGLDLSLYRPLDKSKVRHVLNLPQNKKIILVGAMDILRDPRKGFELLQAALNTLAKSEWAAKAALVIFGASEPVAPPDLGWPAKYLGFLRDEISLALVYAAADVFVASSVQDNLPTTAIEALACGTPVVAFNIGGMPDIVDHQKNGYLARPFEAGDLARGIDWVLSDDQRHFSLCQEARGKAVREFEISLVAQRHLALYQDILRVSDP